MNLKIFRIVEVLVNCSKLKEQKKNSLIKSFKKLLLSVDKISGFNTKYSSVKMNSKDLNFHLVNIIKAISLPFTYSDKK